MEYLKVYMTINNVYTDIAFFYYHMDNQVTIKKKTEADNFLFLLEYLF